MGILSLFNPNKKNVKTNNSVKVSLKQEIDEEKENRMIERQRSFEVDSLISSLNSGLFTDKSADERLEEMQRIDEEEAALLHREEIRAYNKRLDKWLAKQEKKI
mmetsp:Transcript_10082/g.14812  ORF Transcript_10082/g.14812 Transcript_10082/m.14812 type:complete len:104 (-) Transcript_10082:16-327(-)